MSVPENRFSLSAWSIVSSFDYLSRSDRWEGLVAQDAVPFYQRCLYYCNDRSLVCRLLSKLPAAFQLGMVERLIAFGAPQHFVLRKHAIAGQVKTSVAQGVRQLVVLGGGFDLLAFQTAQASPHVHCFEIDTPSMHVHKLALLRAHYGVVPENFYGLGVDLAQASLSSALSSCPDFDSCAPTVVVAEGLTMYLNASQVRGLFEGVRHVCSGAVSVFFTAVPVHPGAKGFWNRVRKLVLGCGDEVPAWSELEQNMGAFLLESGFEQQYQLSYSALQESYRGEHEMVKLRQQAGEYLIFASAVGR